jgi:hypothetical protein
MDGPPPVPRKNSPPVKASIPMDPGRVTPRPASSASKRKREAQDEHAYNLRSNHSEASDAEAYANTHTPKRSRPSLPAPDNDASDDATPVQQNNIRRKKGVNNLSNLNLRHAAERQARLHAERQPVPRESRFQEGSLTDRPSNKPPTVFTRFIRTDSGNIQQVDALMDDYHNGMPSPTGEIDVNREEAQLPPSTAPITPRPEGTDENNNGFLFRFGRSIAASFHPVRMWKQVWEETTDDLRQRNIAEYQRKKALKEEAERRYAEMKASGQFESRTLSRASVTDSSIKTRDSGVMLEHEKQETPSLHHTRNTSYGSQLAPPTIDSSNYSESEAPDTATSVVKTLKSRLHFKRPSLQNLRFDLKRTRSEYNLGAAANIHRDSSSSVSPVKAELEGSALRKSHSRVDMRRQHKLSKRVSDLEVKLQYARRELDDALVQASPALKMGNRSERVTPNSTIRRPRFIPGKLESLPSERLLDPSMYYNEDEDADKVIHDRARAVADLEGVPAEEDNDVMDTTQDNEEETIRASHARPYPARASSLFSLSNNNIENSNEEIAASATKTTSDDMEDNTTEVKKQSTATADAKKKTSGFASLDAKLKALDANVKMAAKKPAQRKKRKTGEDFKDYSPEDDDEDDENADWDKIGSKSKRRKSNNSATKKRSASKSVQDGDEPAVAATTEGLDNYSDEVDTPSKQNDEATTDRSIRMSIDSQAGALEPVLEESEEATFAPNGDPIKKSKYRSSMPIYQPGSDEDLMTRAAAAARLHRSHSPPDAEKSVLSKQHHDTTQQIRAGSEGGSAKSAKSAKSSRSKIPKAKVVDKNFEWPEDVF